MSPQKKFISKVKERGVVTVEFAILLPLIMLILVGLMEGGHLWHLQHTITNASREGARAAIVYKENYSQTEVETRAKEAVRIYLEKFLPKDPPVWETTVVAPATYASGSDVTVRVITNEGMLLLDTIIPAFQGISVQAETTMKLE